MANTSPERLTPADLSGASTPTSRRYPPHPSEYANPAPPSVVNTITSGKDVRRTRKGNRPHIPRIPPPAPKSGNVKKSVPKTIEVKASNQSWKADARCYKKRTVCMSERMDKLSRPNRRNLINHWRQYHSILSPEMILKLHEMLCCEVPKSCKPFNPDQAYELFMTMTKKGGKKKASGKKGKTDNELMLLCGDRGLSWARNATVAFAKGIQQKLGKRGCCVLMDAMERLSDIVLAEMGKFLGCKVSRNSKGKKAKFLVEMADKTAVWIDEILSDAEGRMLLMDAADEYDDDDEGDETGASAASSGTNISRATPTSARPTPAGSGPSTAGSPAANDLLFGSALSGDGSEGDGSGYDPYGGNGRHSRDGYGLDGRRSRNGYGLDGRNSRDGYGLNGRGSRDGYVLNGRDSRDGYGLDGRDSRDGYGLDGRDSRDGYGLDGRDSRDGYGRNGRDSRDGYGLNGRDSRDGYGLDGRDSRDGYGRNGRDSRDGYGLNGRDSRDGYGRNGRDSRDGYGLDGRDKRDGDGRDDGRDTRNDGNVGRDDGRVGRDDARAGRDDGRVGRDDGRAERDVGRDDGRAGRDDGRAETDNGRAGRDDGRAESDDGRAGRDDGRAGRDDGRAGIDDGRAGRDDGREERDGGRDDGRAGRDDGREGRDGGRDDGREGRDGGRDDGKSLEDTNGKDGNRGLSLDRRSLRDTNGRDGNLGFGLDGKSLGDTDGKSLLGQGRNLDDSGAGGGGKKAADYGVGPEQSVKFGLGGTSSTGGGGKKAADYGVGTEQTVKFGLGGTSSTGMRRKSIKFDDEVDTKDALSKKYADVVKNELISAMQKRDKEILVPLPKKSEGSGGAALAGAGAGPGGVGGGAALAGAGAGPGGVGGGGAALAGAGAGPGGVGGGAALAGAGAGPGGVGGDAGVGTSKHPETFYHAAQRIKKAEEIKPVQPGKEPEGDITKHLDDAVKHVPMPRGLLGVMKDHVRDVANFLLKQVFKPKPEIEAQVTLLNEMEKAKDKPLVEGKVPITSGKAAEYLKSLTSYEDKIKKPNSAIQGSVEKKMKDLVDKVPETDAYTEKDMQKVIKEQAGLLTSYAVHQGERTVVLDSLVGTMKKHPDEVILRHGTLKTTADAVQILEDKTMADMYGVTTRDPIIKRKLEIKLDSFADRTRDVLGHPMLKGVMSDVTNYLGVTLLHPHIMKVCRCMKNVSVQCELRCEEMLRRVAWPRCNCWRQLEDRDLMQLAGVQTLQQIPPGKVRFVQCPPFPPAKDDKCHDRSLICPAKEACMNKKCDDRSLICPAKEAYINKKTVFHFQCLTGNTDGLTSSSGSWPIRTYKHSSLSSDSTLSLHSSSDELVISTSTSTSHGVTTSLSSASTTPNEDGGPARAQPLSPCIANASDALEPEDTSATSKAGSCEALLRSMFDVSGDNSDKSVLPVSSPHVNFELPCDRGAEEQPVHSAMDELDFLLNGAPADRDVPQREPSASTPADVPQREPSASTPADVLQREPSASTPSTQPLSYTASSLFSNSASTDLSWRLESNCPISEPARLHAPRIVQEPAERPYVNNEPTALPSDMVVRTDQTYDFQSMLVSLMWNVQACRDWLQATISRALDHRDDSLYPEADVDAYAKWLDFQDITTKEAVQWRHYNTFNKHLANRLVSKYRSKRSLSPLTCAYEECQSGIVEIIDILNKWTHWLIAVLKETIHLEAELDGPPLHKLCWGHFRKKVEAKLNDWDIYNAYLKMCLEQKYSHIMTRCCAGGPMWVVSASGAVPSGAVSAGTARKEPIWVARTIYKSFVLPAALIPSMHCCLVHTNDGTIYRSTNYQVMCNARAEWVPWSSRGPQWGTEGWVGGPLRGREMSTRAVVVSPGVHVGRVQYRDAHLVGAVMAPRNYCHVVIRERPFAFDKYELLVLSSESQSTFSSEDFNKQ